MTEVKPEISENFSHIGENFLPSRRTRKNIVIYTLLLCTSIVYTIIFAGNPENSLHVSALGWAFSVYMTTVFAYVFGAVVDNFNFWKSSKSGQPTKQI